MASLIDRVMGAERLRENPSPNTRAESSMPRVPFCGNARIHLGLCRACR